MPTTNLIPNGDGTNNGVLIATGSGARYEQIDEDISSPDDTTSHLSIQASTHCFFLLTDTPVDFGTATALNLSLRIRTNKSTTVRFYAQLFESDESTAITSEVEFVNSGGTGVFETVTNALTITGATTKAAWDGARLKVRGTTGEGFFNLSTADGSTTYTAAAAGSVGILPYLSLLQG